MRQIHFAGDKLFVADLGASSLTYAEATWTQTLPDRIGAHCPDKRRIRNRLGDVSVAIGKWMDR